MLKAHRHLESMGCTTVFPRVTFECVLTLNTKRGIHSSPSPGGVCVSLAWKKGGGFTLHCLLFFFHFEVTFLYRRGRTTDSALHTNSCPGCPRPRGCIRHHFLQLEGHRTPACTGQRSVFPGYVLERETLDSVEVIFPEQKTNNQAVDDFTPNHYLMYVCMYVCMLRALPQIGVCP